MRHHPLTRLAIVTVAIVALLAIVPTSCKQHPTGGAAADSSGVQRTDSADSAYWEDVVYELGVKVCNYYNANQTDSLEAFVPEAMKVCLEHGKMERYYSIWGFLAEQYVWDDQFDKAVAEAQRMEEDAMKRKDDFGLFKAYYALGIGYTYSKKYEEAVKYYRKAISHFHSPLIAPVCQTYKYLTLTLHDAQQYDALDSTLAEWKPLIDKNTMKEDSPNYKVWGLWNFNYFRTLALSMIEQNKYDAAAVAADSMEHYLVITGNDYYNKTDANHVRSSLARARHDYQTALRYARETMKDAEELDDNSSRKTAMLGIEYALEGLGHYKEALETRRRLNEFSDSLAEVDNREQLNELNKRFEVNELKMESERQQMQAERRQLYLIIAIIVLAALGGGMFFIYRLRSARRLAKMRAAQERIEGELKIARDIQMSMVPSTFPDYEGLDMFASMTPAKEVGGDLYGYVMNGSLLYFAVGDVSGKGVPASLFMAQATRLFRTMAHQGMEPAAICTRMNKELAGDDNVNGMFVTMFIGMLDLEAGHLSFCNAGHNPPVITMDNGQYQFLNILPNAPIGLWPELEYEGEEIESIKGRLLFIYTDGLNEAENTAQEQFGDEHLLEIFRSNQLESSRQVIETLEAEVEKHRNGAEPNDDLTMMGVYLN